MMRRINSVGGMNKTHRLSQGAKKVTPPSIPSFNPRGSGSSFGSDYSYERDTDSGAFSRDPSGASSSTDQRYPKSPGRDSPGDDSSASIGTVESSSVSSGYRNSTTSLDSGRASNSNSTATTDLSSFHTIQPIHEHIAMVNVHPPTSTARFQNSFHGPASSFRQSYHSSTSSLGSADRAEDSICALNIPEMVLNGVADQEILLAWLTDLHYEEYYDLFVNAGYDMPTISRMTPEDLTAIGIKKPNHRKRLKAEITRLNIPDGLPNYIPNTLEDWLFQIRLGEYTCELRNQGYNSVEDVAQISIEDLEDVGLYKLGHQKRLLLAIKRIKELKSGRRIAQYPQQAASPAQSTFMPSTRQLPPQPPVRKPSQQPEIYSSFQQQLPSQRQQNNFPHPIVPNVIQQQPAVVTAASPQPPKPIYQPEIIRIDRRNQPLHIVAAEDPEGSPPPPSPPAMPAPMAPLNSTYARFQAARCFQQQQLPPESGMASIRSDSRPWGTSSMVRSFDDGDIMMNNGGSEYSMMMRNNMALNSSLNSGGGTLPRPKGLVKPRPIAKISASPQQPPLNPSDLQDDLCKKPFSSTDSLKKTSIGSSNEGETFPFANDNIGTIRMRSNASQLSPSSVDTKESDPSQAKRLVTNGGHPQTPQQQRTAGDVLNDIGSMLADLTDELDAMLHMEKDPNKP